MKIVHSQIAIIKLAARTGIEIDAVPEGGAGGSRPREEFKQMIEAHELAANFYSHILLNTVEGEKALDYLEKRGFTRESIEKYGIGWSLDDFEALTGLFKRKNFDMLEMERAGLIDYERRWDRLFRPIPRSSHVSTSE